MDIEEQDQDSRRKKNLLVRVSLMKICVFGLRGFPNVEGGVERHCEELYPVIGEDYEIIVIRRKPYVNSDVQYRNIKFVDLPSTRVPCLETIFHSFIATVYACFTSAAIVHVHNIGPGIFASVLRLFGKKVVLTYHSPNYEHDKWGGFAKKWLRMSERVSMRYADRIIFVNKFQMERYPSRIRSKSLYIPNGVRKAKPAAGTGYIGTLGLVPRKYILYVGRIVPEKGLDVLIGAFGRLETDYRLVIAGSGGPGYSGMLKKMDQSGRVVYTGYISDGQLSEIYTYASLFVLPSMNEGFPIALLEAMSYGLDVLVSDIPATHLVGLEEGDYFCKGDTDDLCRRLGEKIRTNRHRAYDLSCYDWRTIARQVGEVYRSVLSKT